MQTQPNPAAAAQTLTINGRTVQARPIATGIKSRTQALRMLWAGEASGGDPAAWARLTEGLKDLTLLQISKRFAAQGIEISADTAAQLQIEAFVQLPSTELAVVPLDQKSAKSPVDINDGAGAHKVLQSVRPIVPAAGADACTASAASMTRAQNYLLVALLALALGASFHLDEPDDHQADWSDSQALQDLQAAEASSARQQAAAQALCNEARGPNSEARWTSDGHLVCTTRRGLVRMASVGVQQ